MDTSSLTQWLAFAVGAGFALLWVIGLGLSIAQRIRSGSW